MRSAVANRLIRETSPYLLQHAHNPVDWYPWGADALERAVREDKPILVSIGYAACHWCHVMERESFEDDATAQLMNDWFINIKIDREERPDLDHLYMDAVQTLTGSGGWPLHVFLTPDTKPFYGGTYFPPVRAYQRPSWKETLQGVHEAWQQRKHEVLAQADNLTAHLRQSNAFGTTSADREQLISKDNCQAIADNMLQQADKQWGGFGKAPKFPQSFTLLYLLRHYHFTGHRPALDQALLSLDKMMQGGLYDQLGGGFSRYSTDAEWLAPHFEKMLYDNALLVIVYTEAYQLTRQAAYLQVVKKTLAFVERELMSREGGFFTALDADAEGVEGKYYTWSASEIDELLGDDAPLFKLFYGVEPGGNWEHTNILWVAQPLASFCSLHDLEEASMQSLLERSNARLMAVRQQRVRPQLDDKILLGWNALMNKAYCKVYAATLDPHYVAVALRNMNFLFKQFAGSDGRFFHTYKEQARYPAFLDDLAYWTDALIGLYEVSGDPHWLRCAENLTNHIVVHFSDTESPYFFYTSADQQDVIVRKKEVYDGATPSANAVMAMNLHRLSLLLDQPEWGERSQKMLSTLGNAIVRYPTSFGNWACLLLESLMGTNQVTIGAQAHKSLRDKLFDKYIPHRLVMTSAREDQRFESRDMTQSTALWLCRDGTCQPPVDSVDELITLINNAEQRI